MGKVLSLDDGCKRPKQEPLAFDVGGRPTESPLQCELDPTNIVESTLSLVIKGGITRDQLLRLLDDVLAVTPESPDSPKITQAEKEKFRQYLLVVYFLKQLEVFYENNTFTKRTYEGHMSDFVKQGLSIEEALHRLLSASEHDLKTMPAYYYAVVQYLMILLEIEN